MFRLYDTIKENVMKHIPGTDKFLAQPGRKQARKHVREAHDFNNIETRAVIKIFIFLQGKASEEIHTIVKEILACFLPARAKDLSAPLYRWHLNLKMFTKVVSVRYSAYHKAVAQFVEAPHYKPESCGSNPESVIGIFHCYNSSDRTMSLRSIHPLTELSTLNIYWG